MSHKSSFSGDLHFLSNMYPVVCTIGEYNFPCSETAYMSFKTKDKQLLDSIVKEQWPGYKAKRFFRTNPSAIISEWHTIQSDAMWTALNAKFAPSSNMLDRLMRVPIALLVERNTWGDRYWGVDYYTNRGENMLGRMLKGVQQLNHNGQLTADTDFVARLNILTF